MIAHDRSCYWNVAKNVCHCFTLSDETVASSMERETKLVNYDPLLNSAVSPECVSNKFQ